MNNIERLLLEEINTNNFHKAINDDFSFIDSLTDSDDLETTKEDK